VFNRGAFYGAKTAGGLNLKTYYNLVPSLRIFISPQVFTSCRATFPLFFPPKLNIIRKNVYNRCYDFLTFWHRSFTFNSNKSPTWCNNFSVYYPDICLQLNMFRAFSRPSSGAEWLQWQPLVLPSYRGESHAVFGVGRPAQPRRQHDYHHDTKVKPEAATAVIKLLMMGEKTPETCWAVNKRQDNKLKNCWMRLVIYFNCTMMHGLTNLKFYI